MYDTPLTTDEIVRRLTQQPKIIAALTAGMSERRLHRRPSAHEWAVNDVLAHLRSCGDMWGKYIALMLAEDHPSFRAVNPTTWIESTDYPELAFAPSFRAYSKQRAELTRLLRALRPQGWTRSAMVSGAGRPRERRVQEYALWLANHERSHLRQIARLAGRDHFSRDRT
ncbi:MAG: DinB family protein [Chloroflexota bacterium]|nr:DinB family protein [Chloroflexota bacterium]